MKKFLNRLWSVPLVRNVVHTFVQAFLAVFFVGVPLVLSGTHVGGIQAGEHAIVALVTASVAAGVSAAKTVIAAYIQSRRIQ